MNKLLVLNTIALALLSTVTKAQVGIGTTSPHKSALLEIKSNSKGFLPPRVSNDTEIANPAEGLIIYDESDDCLNVYNGGSWIDICTTGSGTPPPSVQDSYFASDCNGAFDISTFGEESYHYGSYTSQFFQMHLNADGSKIYSNTNHYYDTNSTAYTSSSNDEINATSQMVAIEQIFPNKSWKTFFASDGPTYNSPEVLILLAKDGELCSTSLVEKKSTSAVNNYRIGLSTALIDPTDDDKYLTYIGNENNDFRYKPYKHYVNDDVNSNIKFSSLHRQVIGGGIFTVLPYDNVGKKFYSFGAETVDATTYRKIKINKEYLLRTTDPADLRESIVMKEADVINKVISHFNTEFEEGDGVNKTFMGRGSGNISRVLFITKDGYLNALVGGNKVYRYAPPIGQKIVSIPGFANTTSYSISVLCDDGKLHYYNSGFQTTNSYSITGVGNVTLYETNNPSLWFPQSIINNLDIKRIAFSGYNSYSALTTDGKLYTFNHYTNGSAVFIDYHADHNVPLVDELIASKLDMIVRGVDGLCFGVDNAAFASDDLPKTMTGPEPIGLNGFPLNGLPTAVVRANSGRLLNSCFGR